jgi:apolipoprotein N-acyltransferase
MKKWLLILFMLTVLVLVVDKTRKQKGGGREILRRLNATINLLAWFLLVVYGLAFIYWIFKYIFRGG